MPTTNTPICNSLASAGPFANVTAVGTTSYTFEVTYAGTTLIDVSTIDGNDIRVTGPNGFSQLATVVGVTPSGNGSPRTATYRIDAPGGTFGGDDNGTYTIGLLADEVTDTNGVTVPAATFGTFRVSVPQSLIVTNLDDSGPGSLRQAILDANATVGTADGIEFEAGLTGTIALDPAVGQLTITDSVTIIGPGADVLTVDGGGVVRPFNVEAAGVVIDVIISGLTVTGGNGSSGGPTPIAEDGGGIRNADERLTLDGVVITGNSTAATDDGGGIRAAPSAVLTIRNSTISGNTARRGGGVYFFNSGGLLMENSTVSGNTSTESTAVGNGGGGLYFFGTVSGDGFTIRNSTIAGNTAAGSGGGLVLRQFDGTALIQNSTFTGNTAGTAGTAVGEGGGGIALSSGSAASILTIESTIVSGNAAANGRDDIAAIAAATVNVNFSAVGDADGFTLSGTSGDNLAFGEALGLGTLMDNGGPTETISFDSTSPLRDAGSNPANLTTDQRGPGFVREEGSAADIGAFEFQQVAAAPTVTAVDINAGQTNTTQRSRVTSIDVVFSTQVTFAGAVGAAFQLSRIGGGAVGGFTATANVVGGVTVVTLSGFTGAETRSGSLADGRFQLTVRAGQVTAGGVQLDGDGNGTGGDDFVQNGSVANGLFSFYGDATGDGIVNAADFGPFRNAFGTAVGNPLYLAFLDFNNDGFINAFDFGQFRQRFGATVP